MDASLSGIDAVFLDLDGTIYLGGELIEGAEAFLQRCKEHGVQRYFLSNNSSKSVSQYLTKLHALGLEATEDDVLLSTHDLLAWLQTNGITKTWLVGTEGMRSMLEGIGVETRSAAPEYVVLGYDTELTYEKIAQASIHMHAGVPLVASHPDMVCPSPDGGLPDVGAYLAMFKATTGADPEHITGKPNAGMILHKIEALGLQPERCAMVGDRLDTDILFGANNGLKSCLTLSGVTTEAKLLSKDNEIKPDFYVDSIAQFM